MKIGFLVIPAPLLPILGPKGRLYVLLAVTDYLFTAQKPVVWWEVSKLVIGAVAALLITWKAASSTPDGAGSASAWAAPAADIQP